MTSLSELLGLVVGALDRQGVGHALVGGLAVSARAEPRFTRDIDLAVAVADDAAAEEVVRGLADDLRPIAYTEHEALGRLSMVRLASVHHGDAHTTPVVDLHIATSGIEPEVVAAADPVEALPGVVVPLATTGHLIALKLLSRSEDRPQDEWDLRVLVGLAAEEDLRAAQDAVRMIIERGADRQRDLVGDLEALVGGG